MQEFAPKQSRPSGNCPSDSELAAYIDGVLGKEDAARVSEHLASCERCFEVYSETVDFQLAEGEVIPFPLDRRKGRAPRWLAAAAASLTAVVGGWFAYQAFLAPPPEMLVAEIAPDLTGRSVQKLLWDFNQYRGGGDSESELARQSFQVGALLVDFHLAGKEGAAKEASQAWHGIGKATAEAPGMSEFSKTVFKEAVQIDPDSNPEGFSDVLRSVASRSDETETDLRDSVLFPEYVDFGKWIEAGRIAALTQDISFFKDRQNRRFLSYTLEIWKPEKPKEVRKELEAIKRIWERGDNLEPNTYEALAGHFQAILDHYDFRS